MSEFYEGAFDASNPRKGGVFNSFHHDDVTDETAALRLAGESFPVVRHLLQGQQTHEERQRRMINKSMVVDKVKGLHWQILPEKFRPDEIIG